ncbi:MAG: hypothetical protein ABI862_05855 [Ilumatobacteraceae bacterium]
MPQLFSRRKVIGAGGAAALVPLVAIGGVTRAATATGTVTGPVVVLIEPIRVFDSRTAPLGLGGGKLVSGNSNGVSVGLLVQQGFVDNPLAVYLNVTITETEGAGFLLVRASDLVGDRPLPDASNINWSTTGQTLANLVLTAVGGENTLEVHAGGNGRTHYIVDVQGFIPAAP